MNFIYNQAEIWRILERIKIIPNFELALILAQKIREFYVYNTSALEGNTMTYPEVQTLLEGITVGGHKLSEEKQVLNQNESWKLLLELLKNQTFQIDQKTFCRLHSKVAEKEALKWGIFRDKIVGIGGTKHKPPKATELESIFNASVTEIKAIQNPILQGLLFFLSGSINQFFFDGNKRTARLMMNGIFLENGFPILNLLAKDKLEFNEKMIEFYDTHDGTNLLAFLLEYYSKQNENFGE